MAKSFLLLALALVVAARSRVLSTSAAPTTTAMKGTTTKTTTPDLNVTTVSRPEKLKKTQLSSDLLLAQEERSPGELMSHMTHMLETLGAFRVNGGLVTEELVELETKAKKWLLATQNHPGVTPEEYRNLLLTAVNHGSYRDGRDAAMLEANAYKQAYFQAGSHVNTHTQGNNVASILRDIASDRGRMNFGGRRGRH